MFWTKIKVALVVLAVSGVIGSGASWVMTGGGESSSGALVSPVAAAAEPEQKAKPKEGEDKKDKRDQDVLEDTRKLLVEAKKQQILLDEARKRLDEVTARAEVQDQIHSEKLIKVRQNLAELEERLREEEADVKATRRPGADEVVLAKEEDRLRSAILKVKVEEGVKDGPKNGYLERLKKQLEETCVLLEKMEWGRRELRKRLSKRLLETRKEMISTEETLRQLDRNRDRLRQETDRKREAALDRIQQLEGGAVAEAPDRLQKTMERRLEAIQRELTELRRELRRQKSAPKE